MGIYEENLHVMDLERIVEIVQLTVPTVHAYK